MGAWSIPVKAVLAHYVLSGDAAGEDVPAYMKWLFKVDTKARTAYSYADHDYGRRRDLETAVSSFLVTQRQGASLGRPEEILPALWHAVAEEAEWLEQVPSCIVNVRLPDYRAILEQEDQERRAEAMNTMGQGAVGGGALVAGAMAVFNNPSVRSLALQGIRAAAGAAATATTVAAAAGIVVGTLAYAGYKAYHVIYGDESELPLGFPTSCELSLDTLAACADYFLHGAAGEYLEEAAINCFEAFCYTYEALADFKVEWARIQGPYVLFCGQQNAGKTTLLSRLLDKKLPNIGLSKHTEHMIAYPLVEHSGSYGQHTTIHLLDTPGLDSLSPAQRRVAEELMAEAFCPKAVFVVGLNDPTDTTVDAIVKAVCNGKRGLICLNKAVEVNLYQFYDDEEGVLENTKVIEHNWRVSVSAELARRGAKPLNISLLDIWFTELRAIGAELYTRGLTPHGMAAVEHFIEHLPVRTAAQVRMWVTDDALVSDLHDSSDEENTQSVTTASTVE